MHLIYSLANTVVGLSIVFVRSTNNPCGENGLFAKILAKSGTLAILQSDNRMANVMNLKTPCFRTSL